MLRFRGTELYRVNVLNWCKSKIYFIVSDLSQFLMRQDHICVVGFPLPPVHTRSFSALQQCWISSNKKLEKKSEKKLKKWNCVNNHSNQLYFKNLQNSTKPILGQKSDIIVRINFILNFYKRFFMCISKSSVYTTTVIICTKIHKHFLIVFEKCKFSFFYQRTSSDCHFLY